MIRIKIRGKEYTYNDPWKCARFLKWKIHSENLAPWEWELTCLDREDYETIMDLMEDY